MYDSKGFTSENAPSGSQGPEMYADHCLELFFETSLEDAKLLLQPANLLPFSGELGEAIYFASKFEQVDCYCSELSTPFKAVVRVGRPLIIEKQDQIKHYTYSEIRSKGYDSILVTCLEGGNQYAIFNPIQILNIQQIIKPSRDSNKMSIEEPLSDIHQISSHWRGYSPARDRSYNQDPMHFQKYPPLGDQPAVFNESNWQVINQRHHCSYGEKCYRKNPEHIRECHPPGFIPALRY